MFEKLKSFVLVLVLGMCMLIAAQTPVNAQSTNTSQQDSTRPPGTTQQAGAGQGSVNQDPTMPPGTERPSPQTPPGTSVAPSSAAPDALKPASQTGPTAPGSQSPVGTTTDSGQANGNVPLSSLREPRTLPPLPTMERTGVSTDKAMPLSLNEAIRLALANNNDIEIARDDVRFAESSLRALEGVYEPSFQTTSQISHRVTPSASALSGSNPSGILTTNNIDFGQSVTRLFSRGGGQYQLFFNNTRETSNSTNALLSPFYSSSLGIQFTQPLLRNRAIDFNRRNIRVQRKIVAQSDADFRRLTTNVIASVQHAYWELAFALRDRQNRVANLNQARLLFRQTEERIAAGASAPFARAEVETELASREAELLSASQNVTYAENRLKQLILRDPLKPEWFATLIPTDQPTFDKTPITLQDALAEARNNRPDLDYLRLQQEINDIDVQYFKNQARPRVDLQATISTTGLAGSNALLTSASSNPAAVAASLMTSSPGVTGALVDPGAQLLEQINRVKTTQQFSSVSAPLAAATSPTLPGNLVGGYGQMLRNLFSFDTRNVVVGVTIELPFRNTTAREALAGALIRREQVDAKMRSYAQVVEVEVRNAVQTVETARLRTLAARAARESAELQLEGERRLFQVGHSTTFLIFQRENQLTMARTLELRAETDYNNALADLQRATSATLRANNVVVENPVR